MKKILIILIIFLFFMLLSHYVLYAASSKDIYKLAVKSALQKNKEFAFMYYRQLLRDYPQSPYAMEALFGEGEYFFFIPDYDQAYKLFDEYIRRYPDSKAMLFALAYLLKIARIQKKEELAKDIEKKIISVRQVGLVFTDFKEYEYQSPLARKFLAVFHIDKIEFYADDNLFAKISY